jgi:hypothetical protein
MRIGVTLEEKVKSTLKDAAKKLTGPKKRAFMAKVTEDYFDGSARKAETYLVPGRDIAGGGAHDSGGSSDAQPFVAGIEGHLDGGYRGA